MNIFNLHFDSYLLSVEDVETILCNKKDPRRLPYTLQLYPLETSEDKSPAQEEEQEEKEEKEQEEKEEEEEREKEEEKKISAEFKEKICKLF